MQFKKCTVNGTIYGEGVHTEPQNKIKTTSSQTATSLTKIALRNGTIKQDEVKKKDGDIQRQQQKSRFCPWWPKKGSVAPTSIVVARSIEALKDDDLETTTVRTRHASIWGKKPKVVPFSDPLLSQELSNTNHPQYAALRDFFTSLAVCHSVLVEREDNADIKNVKYMAQSPDEAALVDAAKDVGFTFLGRVNASIMVDVLGEEETSTMLNVIEFNSTRKRMSVIVRRPAGEIVLYCKGADSVIYERLAPDQDEIKEITAGHLEDFAEEGLFMCERCQYHLF
jgi:magnesium-transporting ATPase (P-type)